MITIICCYNNQQCLEKMLLPSIKKQNVHVDTILINNNTKKYKSAAEAYNTEWEKAKGDVLIFCHQDIVFDDEKFIEKIENIFHKETSIILGLAGINKKGKVYSNLRYYKTKEYITKTQLKENLEEVESLDECFIAIKKEHFKKIKFDSQVCCGWHLYGTDLSLAAKYSSLKLRPMVTPINAYHKMEPGPRVDMAYLKYMNRLCKKYKEKVKKIYSPCYVVPVKSPAKQFKLFKTYMKIKLKIKD